MKRFFIIFTMIVLSVCLLTSCWKNENNDNNDNNNPPTVDPGTGDNPGDDNPGDDNPGDDNPGDDNPGDDNTGDDEEDQNKELYGELIIPDVKIYTDFPDTPLPTFTKPEYASEITYTVLDNSIIKYENGYFSASRASVATVEATTEHHKTTFKVTAEVYTDHKGVDTANWYLGRVSSMESKWISDGKPTGGTLFIGDSFFDTQFWSDFYQLYGADSNIYTHGVSSSTTTDWEIFAKRLIYPVAPKNIVMHLGTNNIWDDKQATVHVMTNTKRLLDEIHARLPETTIYYFAIEPRSYNTTGGNFDQATYDTINNTNIQMKEYCESTDYLVFVDATPHCYTEGITVNLDFFRDGCHPKLSNYLVYHDLLVEAGLDVEAVESYLNTSAFDIALTDGVGKTNTSIRSNGVVLTNNYSVSGKLKIGEVGKNPHIQFSLDDTNFDNRFLLWDNDENGSFIASYAFNKAHKHAAGDAKVYAEEEVSWELVTTEKHSYFYVNGELEFIFLNYNAKSLVIGAEKTQVSFYDIVSVTSADAEAWAAVLEREEIAKYEASEDTEVKAIVYVEPTTSEFEIAKTDGITSTNRELLVNEVPLSNNYSVSGKLKIGEVGNNPHIQFLLADNNRFLLWDNNNDGTFVPAYQHKGTHVNNVFTTGPIAGEEVAWEVVVTEKHGYFYLNGELVFIFLNINSTSLKIGAEKTQVNFYEIEAVTKEHHAEAWANVMGRGEIYFYETCGETEAKVVKYDSTLANTTEFEIALGTGFATNNTYIVSNGEIISNNYSVSGKMKIAERGEKNPNVQFSLDGTNFQNRFLLWDSDNNGTFFPSFAFGGAHRNSAGKAMINTGEEFTWEVVTTEKHSYFYINGELEFVFLNLNATMLVIGAENAQVLVTDIVTVTAKNNDEAWAAVLARAEIAMHETSEETEPKAWLNTEIMTVDQSTGTTVNRFVYVDGTPITSQFAISGKFKIGTAGNNPHFSFLLAASNIRFVVWDNPLDGKFNVGHEFKPAANITANVGEQQVVAGEEVEWEIVATEKHAYFYINGYLESVLLNVNVNFFAINSTRTAVEFYDIETVLASKDTEAWNAILSRMAIAHYEASEETAQKAIKFDMNMFDTKGFDVALTNGVAATNQHIISNCEVISNNYSVSGKMKITEGGNNPHIQFSLDDTNYNNRFLLWDNDNNGSYVVSYAFNKAHKHGAGQQMFHVNEEFTWEVVTTEKHSYFYINGKLEFVFLNFNAKSLVIGGEKTAFSAYDIVTVTKKYNDEAWAAVLSRTEIAQYEANTETETKAFIHADLTTTSFSIPPISGINGTLREVFIDGVALKNNYSVSGKLKIGEAYNNPHIQFLLASGNRFLLWDNDNNGTYVPGYQHSTGMKNNQGNATPKSGEEVTWEVVVTEKHGYFYVNGELELVFLNINSTSLVFGAEKTQVDFYDITTTLSTDAEAWANVLARAEIATHEASTETVAKAIVA